MYSPNIVLLPGSRSQLPTLVSFHLDSRFPDYSFLNTHQQDPTIRGVLILFTEPPSFTLSYSSSSTSSPSHQPRIRHRWSAVKTNLKTQWKRLLAKNSNQPNHGTDSETAAQTAQSPPGPREADRLARQAEQQQQQPLPTVPTNIAPPQNISFARCDTPPDHETFLKRHRRREARIGRRERDSFSWYGLR